MTQVRVKRGLALDAVLAKILRDNGLHVVKVHNGTITHHGKLEKVRDEPWMEGALMAANAPEGRKSSKEPVSSET